MVLTGYAWWFVRYAPDEEHLLEAQEGAKEAKRGLWAEPEAVRPWDWRKGVRRLGKRNLAITADRKGWSHFLGTLKSRDGYSPSGQIKPLIWIVGPLMSPFRRSY